MDLLDTYLAVNIEITFPESRGRKAKVLKSASSFKVDSSWQNLTDTAEVIIAKALYLEQEQRVFELLKPGDPIIIKGGYNGEYYEEFSGFISEVLDDLPVMLKCEDNMYVLKRTKCHCSYNSTTLEKLLKAIMPPQFKINAADMQIGSVLFRNFTVSQALQELKDKMGIYSYFVGDTLVSGKIYQDNPETEKVKYVFGKNIIQNDLKYRRKEDFKMYVKAIGRLPNGTKIEERVGDDEGQESKLEYSNVSSRTELKKRAQYDYDRLKIDGYAGTLTGFGIPFVRHGYKAEIVNYDNEDRNDTNYVDGVVTSCSNNGAYRRVSRIGKRAANG